MRPMRTLVIGLSLLWALACATMPARAAEPDFNHEVRPILSLHCFKCHGPDEGQRKAGLRLDERTGAVGLLPDGHRAIVPGKPQLGSFMQRILSHGLDIMPPAYANKPLTPLEKTTLSRWIASGAPYRPHWAFVPPKQAPLPLVKLTSWPRNPIDNFVLARLEKAGLKPSPPADRYTLARRVYLDLIGLPPTPEEADAFVRDRRPDAYERLVDRLLASPHYGERWARRWLDLARYSDTNGYEKDRPRSIWPYRDWVIDALNRDMPFDRFTIEQIAGDLLPNSTQEQRIATGFHRNTMLNEEGGIDPLEYRFNSMVDRVATTGTVWLGLTLGCAQCHTHKFDPITHREYYRTMACLDNADELTIDVQKPDIAAQRRKIEALVEEREARLAERFPDPDHPGSLLPAIMVEAKFQAWLREQEPKAVSWRVLRPVKATSNLPLLTVQPDDSVFVSGDMTKRDLYDLEFHNDGGPIAAVRLEALPDDRLPAHGPGRVYYEGGFGDFFLSEITLTAGGQAAKFASATQSGGGDAQAAIDGDPQTGWNINGRQGEATVAVFRLKEPVKADAFDLSLLFERYHAAGLGRFRISVTSDSRPAGADLPPDIEALLLIPEAQRTPEQRRQLLRYYLTVAPELKAERDQIAKLRATLPAYPTTLVFAERPADNPRPTYIHKRGEWLQPQERVTPGVPAILPPLPAGAPANRLTFARWLVSPANPLVGRVTMNRQWAAFFGKGIVRTTEDFGYQGEPPSHPELLDWLAVEFVKRGWSLKQMHRLIVTSATYRQSSAVTPALLARDPENRLLSRGPRVRLEAELVRDSLLTASGLLSGKIGGPSVFPSQPPGVTSEGTYGPLEWKVSPGEDRYRRGLYTFSKRTAPYAMFQTFDAPSGEVCTARREVSNTPLQALTLLNDQVCVEAAQALGKMIATRPGALEERAAYLYRRCVTRPPTPAETAALLRYYMAQKARCDRKELDAAAIAGPGGDGDINDRAAWTLLARSLLNLDQAITKT
jgi:hypothetical protein